MENFIKGKENFKNIRESNEVLLTTNRNRHSGQSDSHRQRAGLDLRDRLNNRNQGGGSRHRPKDNRNRGDHKRGDSRRGPPHSGGLAQGASRSSHKDGGSDSRDRDERDLRLQRMMTATQTKGQLISKSLFAILEFFQKMNETIQALLGQKK